MATVLTKLLGDIIKLFYYSQTCYQKVFKTAQAPRQDPMPVMPNFENFLKNSIFAQSRLMCHLLPCTQTVLQPYLHTWRAQVKDIRTHGSWAQPKCSFKEPRIWSPSPSCAWQGSDFPWTRGRRSHPWTRELEPDLFWGLVVGRDIALSVAYFKLRFNWDSGKTARSVWE